MIQNLVFEENTSKLFNKILLNNKNIEQLFILYNSVEKIEQERASFRTIQDSFKKIFIVRDVINVQRDNDGFTTMSIFDFLLNDNSLEQ